ncbi:MAG: hypothetical protein Q8Q32_02550 [bacterium]|nr:hypothetical protein [bacterium]
MPEAGKRAGRMTKGKKGVKIVVFWAKKVNIRLLKTGFDSLFNGAIVASIE